MSMTKEELMKKCVDVLHETFDIPVENIKPESRLYDDLDIDSIDAVDLIVRMKPMVGKRLQPEAFKAVRTVQDVVDALHTLIHSSDAA
ncbi:MAG: acyl carrier protein [Myxococcaceae bacterium]